MSDEELKKVANEVRKGIVTGVHAAKSGHPGGSLGAADIMTYLYFEEMNVDPADPRKADRDRFVLSKGHCAPGLYAVLAERGFFPKEDLETRTYALLGDGESEEGQVWEAAMFAGNQQLDNLCVIVDHNGLQIDGPVEEVNDPMPLADKFRAFKFHVVELADGNDFDQIRAAFAEARATKGQPTAIIAETMKGKGVSFMENQVGWHGKAPNDEQFEQAMAELTAAGEEL